MKLWIVFRLHLYLAQLAKLDSAKGILTCDDNSCYEVSSFLFNINSEAVTSWRSLKNVLPKILQSLQKNQPRWSHFLKLSCSALVFNFNKRGPGKGGGFCKFCEIFKNA